MYTYIIILMYTCRFALQRGDSMEVRSRYFKYALNTGLSRTAKTKAIEYASCPYTGCDAIYCVPSRAVDIQQIPIDNIEPHCCRGCLNVLCGNCFTPWTELSHTCEHLVNFNARKEQERQKENGKTDALQIGMAFCPECAVLVDKSDGCNHVSYLY